MRGWSWMIPVTLVLVGAGCKLYDPEGYRLNLGTGGIDHGPSEEEVFEAAKQEILERYPEAAISERSNLILALSPVEMQGASKTRKQITVHVKKLYTGAWEPLVRVVLHAEVGEPRLETDIDSEDPVGANTVAEQKWQALQHLPVEETAIHDGIWRKVNGEAEPAPAATDDADGENNRA